MFKNTAITLNHERLTVKKQFHTLKFEKSFCVRYLMPFSTTYLCEQGFSALLIIKNKSRNLLKVSDDMHAALRKNITLRIQVLVQKMQA